MKNLCLFPLAFFLFVIIHECTAETMKRIGEPSPVRGPVAARGDLTLQPGPLRGSARRGIVEQDAPPRKPHVAVIQKQIDADIDSLLALYKHIHAHPELAFQEEQTSARLAKELRAAGFEVAEKVGVTGVVGVFKNGSGPTILVRADMDALPIVEQTGLAYASKVRTRDKDGLDVGVMHACGHDMNVS